MHIMKRYFIKIKSSKLGYRYACFICAYDDNYKVGNLVYRYINKNISKRETIFLDKIKFQVFVYKDTSSPNKIMSFFYDKYKPNESIIIELDNKYVKSRDSNYKIVRYKGDNIVDPVQIYLPTFYDELINCNTNEYFRILILGGADSYMQFMKRFGNDICKIICYKQFNFEKYVDYPDFFEDYKTFLQDNYIEVRLDSPTTSIDDPPEYCTDDYKHENHVRVSFKQMFNYVNKKLPTPKNSFSLK